MRRENSKAIVLLVTSFASFVTPFLMSSVNVALPQIGKDLRIDAVLMTWVASVFLLATAVFILPAGRLGDIYGRKRVMKIGLWVTTLSILFAGMSGSVTSLLFWRVIQGIGSALIFGTSLAILTSVFEKGERGKAIGINLAAVYIGLTVGPYLGGLLTDHFGWRSIFFFLVPFGIISIILAQRIKKEWADAHGESFDFIGSMLYGAAIILIMYSLSVIPDTQGYLMLFAGLVLIVIFLMFEHKKNEPILQLGIWKSKGFSFSSIAALLNYSSTSAVSFLISLYLQLAKGLGPQKAGLILLIQPIMMAIFSPIIGRISDKVEPRFLSSAGMMVTGVGILLLVRLSMDTTIMHISAALFMIGMGFALFSSPNMSAIMGNVEKRFYGIAGGIVATMRLLGQMLSIGIAMLLISIYVGRMEITTGNISSFLVASRIALAIFAALSFAGTYFSMARGNLH